MTGLGQATLPGESLTGGERSPRRTARHSVVSDSPVIWINSRREIYVGTGAAWSRAISFVLMTTQCARRGARRIGE